MKKRKTKPFVVRNFLNHPDSPSTGTIYAYSGPSPFDKGETTFLEIADCHQSCRLHMNKLDDIYDFIDKLKVIEKTVKKMRKHLEKDSKKDLNE